MATQSWQKTRIEFKSGYTAQFGMSEISFRVEKIRILQRAKGTAISSNELCLDIGRDGQQRAIAAI